MKASASNLQTQDEEYAGEAGRPDWKAELNAKLAEHRQRRAAAGHWSDDAPGAAQTGQTEALGRETTAARVAARVAARYAQAPSYSELLAASAAAAAEAAVAAEHAAIAAREANEAAEIFFAETAQAEAQMRERAEHGAAMAVVSPIRRAELEGAQGQLAGMGLEARDAYPEQFDLAAAATGDRRIDATVQHPEPLPARTVVPERPATSEAWSFPASGVRGIVDAMAEAIVPPARSLPAKLIEFPRELIASRKARPRIAEGPLLEERGGELVPVPGSLRIFEVADRDGASGPVSASRLFEHGSEGGSARRETGRAQAAEEGSGWQSIRLGEHPGAEGEGVEGAKQAAYRHAASSAPALTRAAASHAALQTASIGGPGDGSAGGRSAGGNGVSHLCSGVCELLDACGAGQADAGSGRWSAGRVPAALPVAVYALCPVGRPECDTRALRYARSKMKTPRARCASGACWLECWQLCRQGSV